MEVTTTRAPATAVLRLGLLLTFEIGAIIALHTVGRLSMMEIDTANLSQWLSDTPTQDAVVAVVRLIALAAAYWLFLSTVLYLVAAATKIPGFIRSIAWFALPGIRRVVDGALVLTIVGSSVIGSGRMAMAQDASSTTGAPVIEHVYTPRADVNVDAKTPGGSAQVSAPTTATPTTTPTGDGDPGDYLPKPDGDVTTTATPTTATPTTATPTTSTPAPTTTQRPAPTTQIAPPTAPTNPAPTPLPAPAPIPVAHGAEAYTVVRGDNFWTISERHLETTLGRSASLDEVRTYWLRVIEENRDAIRSGNPNLIYPGEVFVLPSVI